MDFSSPTNNKGKFEYYCEQNGIYLYLYWVISPIFNIYVIYQYIGFEPGDIPDELQAGAQDCTLVDFDKENFPLPDSVDKNNEKAVNNHIFKL